MTTNKKEEVYAIILYLYKLNTQICRKKQLGLYHKVDPTVLWLVNIVYCQRRPIFAYFIKASTFTITFLLNCYDNYIYKDDLNGDILVEKYMTS